MRTLLYGILSLLLLFGCTSKKSIPTNETSTSLISILAEELFDTSRSRRDSKI